MKMEKYRVIMNLLKGRGVMFFGEVESCIDDKNRIRIPTKFKDIGSEVTVAKGLNGCLTIYDKESMAVLYAKLKEIPLSDMAAQRSVRAFFSSASTVQIDSNGRFVLPLALKTYAGIDKDIVLVGMGEKMEIWSKARWSAYDACGDYDKTFAELEKYGV